MPSFVVQEIAPPETPTPRADLTVNRIDRVPVVVASITSEGWLQPAAVLALTRILYTHPASRPDIDFEAELLVLVVQVEPFFECSILYSLTDSPSVSGTFQFTSMDVLVDAFLLSPVGLAGKFAVRSETGVDASLQPAAVWVDTFTK